MRVDVHQHLWTDGLRDALARRQAPPRIRRFARGSVLELSGEAPFRLPDGEQQQPVAREQDLDMAIVALSTALGVETLPDAEARAIIGAWDEDADSLPKEVPAWGSLPLADPDPDDVDGALDRGRVGLTVPASALGDPRALDRVAPLLDRLADRDAPLFVHPGPAAPGTWLPPLTAYVSSLAQAWYAWTLHGRVRHPRLRILFAALAGLAPLQAERLAARVPGAPATAALEDPHVFYETSSYGRIAVEAMAGVVGFDALVYGSDRPYSDPNLSDEAVARVLARANVKLLIGGETAR